MFARRLLATKPVFHSVRLATTRSIHASATKEAYLEHLQGDNHGISVLKLNRPVARNALSVKLVTEIRDCLAEIRFNSK
jgi:methylglutaconyl-CoA hydratase